MSNSGSAVVGGGIAVLLGVSPLPSSFPLVALARSAPVVALTLGGVLALLVTIALTILERGRGALGATGHLGARAGRFLISSLLSALASVVIGVLFGFNDLPSAIPLLSLIRTHPPLGIGIVAVLLALLIFSPFFGWGAGPEPAGGNGPQAPRRLLAATIISTLSALLFVSLLATVVARPAWCPTEICPAPVLVTNPLGNSDGTLEVFYTATQSATAVIPNDVSQYSLAQNNLPRETSAIRIDEKYPPYRAVIGVHSLQRKVGAGLIIQQVTMVLDAVDTAPTPLNVWTTGAPNDFASNPYLVTFRGEAAGARLIAASIHTPPTYTDLREGESDEIDLQFTARQVGAIRFHVEVAYTVKGDAVVQVVALTKHDFAVVFSDATNWHRYQFGPDGHFALAGS